MTKYKIFSLDYLSTAELTEEDLYYIFDTPSLHYSMIKDMYIQTEEYTDIRHIIDKISQNSDWVYERHFSNLTEYKKFKNKLIDVIKNVYWYSDLLATKWVENRIFMFLFILRLLY